MWIGFGMFNKQKWGQCSWSLSEWGGEWPVRDEAEGTAPSRTLFIGHDEEFGFFSKKYCGTCRRSFTLKVEWFSLYVKSIVLKDRSYWNVSFRIYFCAFSWIFYSTLSRLWLFRFNFLLSIAFLGYLDLGLGWLLFIQEATECSQNLTWAL